jgi:hypothetical protein
MSGFPQVKMSGMDNLPRGREIEHRTFTINESKRIKSPITNRKDTGPRT